MDGFVERTGERVADLQSAWWPLELVDATAIDAGTSALTAEQRRP
jgi:hypothetical protein